MLAKMGMISYSNALPLSYTLADDPELTVHYDTPNNLHHALKEAKLDYSLTSSLHLQDETLIPFSDYGISAHKEVLSVNLYHKVPLSKLDGKTIAISNETSTSLALLKILCRELWKVTPHFEILSEGQTIESYEAALLIGDIALKEHRGFLVCDLATAWYELTGLPFVFALFFAQKTTPFLSELNKKIGSSLQSGLQQLIPISERVALEKSLPFELVCNYYDKLNYTLGPREKEGLAQFIALQKKSHDAYL